MMVTEYLRDGVGLVIVLAFREGEQLRLEHRKPRRPLRQVHLPSLESGRLDRHAGDLVPLRPDRNGSAPMLAQLLDQRRPGADILNQNTAWLVKVGQRERPRPKGREVVVA